MNKEKLIKIGERLNIQMCYCRSGQGLMSYGYNFVQIGGFIGQSNDLVKRHEPWDGNLKAGESILDYRSGKCVKLSRQEFIALIEKEYEKEGHPTEIKHYNLKDLAEAIGNLRYDKLSEFLEALALKIDKDEDSDRKRNRTKLANSLADLADELWDGKRTADRLWEICEPYEIKT